MAPKGISIVWNDFPLCVFTERFFYSEKTAAGRTESESGLWPVPRAFTPFGTEIFFRKIYKEVKKWEIVVVIIANYFGL